MGSSSEANVTIGSSSRGSGGRTHCAGNTSGTTTTTTITTTIITITIITVIITIITRAWARSNGRERRRNTSKMMHAGMLTHSGMMLMHTSMHAVLMLKCSLMRMWQRSVPVPTGCTHTSNSESMRCHVSGRHLRVTITLRVNIILHDIITLRVNIILQDIITLRVIIILFMSRSWEREGGEGGIGRSTTIGISNGRSGRGGWICGSGNCSWMEVSQRSAVRSTKPSRGIIYAALSIDVSPRGRRDTANRTTERRCA